MGFSPDGRYLYHTDTQRRTIYQYAYDATTGALGIRSTFVTVEDGVGVPDGLTIDAEGCVWSARWNGGCVVRYDSDGSELLRIDFLVPKFSSVRFGGPEHEHLYVTTAGGGARGVEGPQAGALFRVQGVGVRGVPEHRSRVAIPRRQLGQ